MNKSFKRIAIIASFLLLIACGGSSSDDTEFLTAAIDINVALASSGSSAFANYNNVQAGKVIDGNTSTSEFWSGNISDDFVRVDFGKIRNLKEISVYTNDTSFNSNDPNKLIELSTDSVNWKTTAQVSGGDISCSSFLTSSTRIKCTFATRQQARYYRFTVKETGSDAALLNVYEMQAIGF